MKNLLKLSRLFINVDSVKYVTEVVTEKGKIFLHVETVSGAEMNLDIEKEMETFLEKFLSTQPYIQGKRPNQGMLISFGSESTDTMEFTPNEVPVNVWINTKHLESLHFPKDINRVEFEGVEGYLDYYFNCSKVVYFLDSEIEKLNKPQKISKKAIIDRNHLRHIIYKSFVDDTANQLCDFCFNYEWFSDSILREFFTVRLENLSKLDSWSDSVEGFEFWNGVSDLFSLHFGKDEAANLLKTLIICL